MRKFDSKRIYKNYGNKERNMKDKIYRFKKEEDRMDDVYKYEMEEVYAN